MTDTELIATKLLGWKEIPTEGTEWYNWAGPLFKRGQDYVLFDRGYIYYGRDNWPDFTTLDGCRLFEEKIPLSGRYGYIETLIEIAMADGLTVNREYALLFATPAHRVTACIRVIKELNR